MSGEPSGYLVPPPRDPEAFERYIRDLFEAEWQAHAKMHGRRGQPQNGVDVYGQPRGAAGYHGVQCKRHDGQTHGKVTETELLEEIEKARQFTPHLVRFILATTGPRDAKVQAAVRRFNESKDKAFPVQVMFWEDILDMYDRHRDIFAQHYPDAGLSPRTPRRTATVLVANTFKLPAEPSPATLLNAKYRAVEFSRAVCAELWDELARWCDDAGEKVGVRLIVGPGGSGKTRLGIEFAAATRERGWEAGFLGEAATAEELDALVTSSRPVLAIIDYAETRPELAAMLKRLTRGPREESLRILLVAREVADWWRSLQKQADELNDLLGRHLPVELRPVPLEGELQQRLFEQARERFAQVRKRQAPTAAVDLSDEHFGRPLYVQMAALAVVDGFDAQADKLLDGVVDHEQHFWHHRFASEHSGNYFDQQEFIEAASRTVAALTLRGGAGEFEEAGRINDAAKGPRQEGFVRFLHSLYPGRAGESAGRGYLGGLEPDLLGEELVQRVLLDEHTPRDYLLNVFADNDPPALTQAFVVLGRLSLRNQSAIEWMKKLLAADVKGRAQPAFLAAMTLGEWSAYGELGRILAGCLEQGGTLEAAALIDRMAPEQTVSLRELCAWAERRLLAELPNDSTEHEVLEERARLLNNLGNRLSELGQREAALEATREAVEIRRKLAAARPDAFLPDLAGSLNNLGIRLSDLGQREAALAATREAVEIRRKLAAARPDAFLPDLAGSLNNLGKMLSELGQREAALEATREAVEIRRKLAAARPDAFLPDLAGSLNNLGNRLSELGQREAALEATREAAERYRELAAARPDAFLPDLAGSLNNLGNRLSELGQREAALAATREAVEHYVSVFRWAPARYGRELGIAARNLRKRCEEAGVDAASEAVIGEAEKLLATEARSQKSEVRSNK